MKVFRCISLALLALSSISQSILNAQIITGPDTVCMGEIQTYKITSYTTNHIFLWSGSRAYPSQSVKDSNEVTFGNAGTATIYVTVLDSTGATMGSHSRTVYVSSKPFPYIYSDNELACNLQIDEAMYVDTPYCAKVCDSSSVRYYTNNTPGHTYSWNVNNALSVTPNGNEVTVLWNNQAGFGRVELTETNEDGCTETFEICVEIIEKPEARAAVGNIGSVDVCVGQVLPFINYTTGASSFYWDFGDGSTSTQEHFRHGYSSAGTYTYKLFAYNDCGCVDSLTGTINVINGIEPEIECISTICEGSRQVYTTSHYFKNYSQWYVNTGHGTIVPPTRTEQTLIVDWGGGVDGFGEIHFDAGQQGYCQTTKRVPIITDSNVVIDGKTIVCGNSQETYRIPPMPGSIFTWTVTGGTFAYNGQTTYQSADIREVKIDWDTSSTGTIEVRYYNQPLGCGDTLELSVDKIYDYSISGPTGSCVNTNLSFSAGSDTSASFFWKVYHKQFGLVDTMTSSNNSIQYSFIQPGDYIITSYNISFDYCNYEDQHEISVDGNIPTPDPIIGDTLICPYSVYQYISATHSNQYFLEWNIQGGTPNTSNGDYVNIRWDSTGPYSIVLYQVGVNYPYCKSDSVILNITEKTAPEFDILGDTVVCTNSIGDYTLSQSASYYEWWFYDATKASITSGQYYDSVNVQWNNDTSINPPDTLYALMVECFDTTFGKLPIQIYGNPVPDIVVDPNDSIKCHNTEYKLYLNHYDTSISSSSWTNWNGNIFNTDTLFSTFDSSGSYLIEVDIEHGGICPDTIHLSQIFNIHQGPIGFLSIDTNWGCTNPDTLDARLQVTTMQNSISSPYTYQWYKDGSSYTPSSGDKLYDDLLINYMGRYIVLVTDTLLGCSDSTNAFIIDSCIQQEPDTGRPLCLWWPAGFESIYDGCGKFTFNDTTSKPPAQSVTWDYNGYGGATTTDTTYTYNRAGYYDVWMFPKYIAQDTNCNIEKVRTVKVPLIADFTYQMFCDTGNGMLVKLIDETSWIENPVNDWTWVVDGDTTTGLNPSIYMSAGTHSVTLVSASKFGSYYSGPCSKTKSVFIPNRGFAGFSIPSGPHCEETPLKFTDNSTGSVVYREWDFYDGSGSNLTNPFRVFEVNISDEFYIKLTSIDSLNCSDSIIDTLYIHNNDMKEAKIEKLGADPFCLGDSIGLIVNPAQIGNYPPFTFQWSIGGMHDHDSIIYIKNGGNFNVLIENKNKCLAFPPSISLLAIVPPASIPRGQTEYCPDDLVELDMYRGNLWDYEWYKNSTLLGDSSYVSYVAGSTGVEDVMAVVSDGTCSDTSIIEITSKAVPSISSITSSPDSCEKSEPTITAVASGSGLVYNWSNGMAGNSIQVDHSGPYRVTVTNDVGCDTSGLIEIYSMPDFSSFMTGCYTFCYDDTGSVVFQGLHPYYFDHTWIPYALGSTGYNPTLSLSNHGPYSYRLKASNNFSSGCYDTSEVLDVEIIGCDPCPADSIDSLTITCLERDSNLNWSYSYEFIVNSHTAGNIVISAKYADSISVNTSTLTTSIDTISGTIWSTNDSMHFDIEMYWPSTNFCNYSLFDTLPECHMPCMVDSILIDSIVCEGKDPDSNLLYKFYSRIYNAGSVAINYHASIDSGNITGLSLDSLYYGMNNVTGYIRTMTSGNKCINFGFYVDPPQSEECCEQEVCVTLPSCSELSECSDLEFDHWEVNCIGLDEDNHGMYSFSVEITNNGSAVYDYLYGSSGGYVFGMSPIYIGTNTTDLTGLYVNESDTDLVCLYLTLRDTSNGDLCYYELCSDPPIDDCDEGEDCGWLDGPIVLSCEGTDGDGNKYYSFSYTVTNGNYVGPVYTTNPNLWIDQSSVTSGSNVLTGGFYNPDGLTSVCSEIIIYDNLSEQFCEDEICFSSLPTCCTTISSKKGDRSEEESELTIEDKRSDFKIYPNPTSEQVQFEYSIKDGTTAKIEVFSMYSSSIKSYEALRGKGIVKMSTSGLDAGLYIVRLTIDDEVVSSSKLVIIH